MDNYNQRTEFTSASKRRLDLVGNESEARPLVGEVTTSPGITRSLALTLESFDLDSVEVFSSVGLDISNGISTQERFAAKKMQQVWRKSVELTGNEAFGILAVQNIQLGTLHGLGIACRASATIYDGFQRLVRYFRVLTTSGRVELIEEGDQLRVELNLPVPGSQIAPASLDAGLALFVELARQTRHLHVDPLSVETERLPPDDIAPFHDYFSCPVKFAADRTCLIFDRRDMDTPMPVANPELARANDRVVIEYLKRFDQSNILSQVRAKIIDALPSGAPSQKDIAASVFLSPRSLQRKLAEEGVTFTGVLEEVREHLAREYLGSPSRSVGEVSYLLGFSEPSNFARAFKRWTGMTPNQFQAK